MSSEFVVLCWWIFCGVTWCNSGALLMQKMHMLKQGMCPTSQTISEWSGTCRYCLPSLTHHTPSPRCCQAAEMKVNTSTGNAFSHTRRLGRATAISQFQIPGSFGLRNFQYNCYNLQSEFSILNSNHDTEISDFMQISHVYIS